MNHSYGIINLLAVPIRSKPEHSSEMVNQLLYNEMIEILNTQGDWVYIRSKHDQYEGWLRSNQFKKISEELFGRKAVAYIQELFKEDKLRYLLGTPIYTSDFQNKVLGKQFVFDLAWKLLETPYLWGGRTPMGMDCSGFIQILFRFVDLELKRDAHQQAESGIEIAWGAHKKGDLAFFINEQNKITHVGMIWSENELIHASGKVRIDQLQKEGIFLNKKRTHILHSIRRLF